MYVRVGSSLFRCSILILVVFLILCECKGKKKTGVKIEIESKPNECADGTGVTKGSTVVVHYTGALENGQVFDTSRREGRGPFTVTLGANQVIKGWEEGLIGMCPGEVRKLTIPPHLGYGDQGVPNVIPPGATLIFSVELVEIQQKPLISIPRGSGFYTFLGVVAVILLIAYEMYKRTRQHSEEIKKQKKAHSSRPQKGKKTKKN